MIGMVYEGTCEKTFATGACGECERCLTELQAFGTSAGTDFVPVEMQGNVAMLKFTEDQLEYIISRGFMPLTPHGRSKLIEALKMAQN